MHKTIERGDCTMDSQIRPYLMYKTIFLMMIVAKVTQSSCYDNAEDNGTGEYILNM